MALISLENVSFTYPGGFNAVDSVSITIEKGENIAIVGQNGAGKTTTVKMCNRLLCPSSGNVIVDGKNTRNHTTAQISRIVGYVFQNPDDQIFHSTIAQEVEFGPRMMGLPEDRAAALVTDALTLTGLAKEREENPYNLPLSIRKFITIASVIAMNTQVIILDEPTAGQDVEGNRRLKNIMSAMLERGKTLITISHDMEFVAENFSRVIVMADKRVITDGSPRDVFWNFDALETARLTQPHVSRVCRRLGLGNRAIHLAEAADTIMAKLSR
jgi:energy-coupling factor transport system ATP-binding protein